MPCLLFLLAPPPRPCLADSVSRSPLPNKYRFFLPQTRRRPSPRLGDGVRMAEMTRVWSGGEPLEVGVSMESDPIVGGEAPSRSRWEASRWAPVEAALNRMIDSNQGLSRLRNFVAKLKKGCIEPKSLPKGTKAPGYSGSSIYRERPLLYLRKAIWKRDAEIMWVLLGAVGNSLLSLVLKKMLNHERPAPALRSDPGMPSSHAQSIFYAATVLALSLYYWLGTNYLTMILGPATLSLAAYLSWLRVSRGLHTLNQVMVGAVVGSAVGALWFVLWHWLVQEAFASSVLVRVAVILGSSAFCVSFVVYMIRHWLKDE
ncbi:Lipid phosphate phosphatase epsilon 2 chloroplastic [Zea mays]|uniref:Lipid phosphate phosphatase epsilon 2 chloroplastic n=1 Tax=Zea mays TaxID=4577 RepID=A0A1D6Q7Z1_MAIZE|nr:Lipid phosphate phosphatase epsilon 2 chloroplastic [Zea mays]